MHQKSILACALVQTMPLLSRHLMTRQWRLFEGPLVALYLGVFDMDSVGQKAHRLSAQSEFM